MNTKFQDLTGQKFGRLTVIERAPNKNQKTYWVCECNCGSNKEVVVWATSLKNGDIKSCGCLKVEMLNKRNFKDLTGQRFGKLVVLEYAGATDKQRGLWKCRCDCDLNKIIIVTTSNLTSGNTTSCGCKWYDEKGDWKFFKDISGQVFGRLTAIERADDRIDPSGKPTTMWKCICSCDGKELVVSGQSLRNGSSKSCGCLQKEIVSNRAKKQFGEATFNSVLRTYKDGAKSRNLEFSLTDEEFYNLTQQNCFYCNSEPNQISKNPNNNGDFIYNGLDRVDSSKGYSKENVVPCCIQCNRAKTDLTQQKFYDWIDQVYHHIHQEILA